MPSSHWNGHVAPRFEPTTAGQRIKPLRTAKRHNYAPACSSLWMVIRLQKTNGWEYEKTGTVPGMRFALTH